MAKRKKARIEVFHGTARFDLKKKTTGILFNLGEWYWRARAKNGRIVAVSGEGYKRQTTCEKMALKYGPQDVSDFDSNPWPIEVMQ